MTGHKFQIMLQGGPLHGIVHERNPDYEKYGNLESFGLRFDDTIRLAWYNVIHGRCVVGVFDKITEA